MINKSRLAAFTDGIAAIAATIMVLELGVPKTDDWIGLLSQKNVLLAYAVSYLMIYLAWFTHHNLFQKAEVISAKAFIINGIWLLLLTLVPFTTAWVGKAGSSPAPRVLYTSNLLLWSVTFHWMEYQVQKDNPEIPLNEASQSTERFILYGGYALSFVFAFLLRTGVVPLIGIIGVILIARAWMRSGK